MKTKIIAISFILLCSFILPRLAIAQTNLDSHLDKFIHFTRIQLRLKPETKYKITKIKRKSSLDITLENYPLDIIRQLEKYQGTNITGILVLHKSLTSIKVRMNINLTRFLFFHRWIKKPPGLIIDIGEGEEDILPIKIPDIPFVPYIEERLPIKGGTPDIDFQRLEVRHPHIKIHNDLISLWSKGFIKESVQKADTFLKSHPKSPYYHKIYYIYAEMLFMLHRNTPSTIEVAIDALKRVSKMKLYDDLNARALYLASLGNILRRFYLEALVDIEKGLAKYRHTLYYNYLKVNQAICLKYRRKVKKAEVILRQIVEYPQDIPAKKNALLLLAYIEAEKLNFNQAFKLMAQIEKKWPVLLKRNINVFLFLGDLHFWKKDYKRAEQIYNKVLLQFSYEPLSSIAQLHKGDILLKQKKYDQASLIFRHLANLRGKRMDARLLARMRVAELEGAMYSTSPPYHNYYMCINKARASFASQEASFRLSLLYLQHRKFILAYDTMRKMFKKYPNTPYSNTGKPFFHNLLYTIYKMYYKKGDYLTVTRIYIRDKKIFSQNPHEKEMRILVANSYIAMGIYQEALKLYRAILKSKGLEPKWEKRYLINLAHAYALNKDIYRCQKTLEYLRAKYPGQIKSSKYWLTMAEINLALKKDREAFSAFDNMLKYLDEFPNQTLIYTKQGDILKRHKKYAAAAEKYNKAIVYYRNYPSNKLPKEIVGTFFNFGECLLWSKQYRETIEYFNTLIKKFPNNSRIPMVKYKLGEAFSKVGMKNESFKTWKALAAEKEPGFWHKLAAEQIRGLEWEKKHRRQPELKTPSP